MAIYHSLGMDGVPFGVRYPSEQMCRDAAQKTMGEFSDIDRVEILKITTQSFGYEYRKVAKNPEAVARTDAILADEPFKGISLI